MKSNWIAPLRLACVIIAVALCSSAVDGCSKKKPDTLVEEGYDKQEMEAAIAHAKRELPRFIEAFRTRAGDDFSVKVPIREGANTEHFWMVEIKLEGDYFVGKIGNEAGIVHGITYGQPYRIHKDEISDWLYIKDGKMYGNYTLRPLLKTMSTEEADSYRAMFAEP